MPDGIKQNPSILTRVLNTFKAWVPLNRAHSETPIPHTTRTDDVTKISKVGRLGPMSLSPASEKDSRTNISHNLVAEPDRRDRTTKSNVKPSKSLNTTPSKEAQSETNTVEDKLNEDSTDYSVLLQLLAPKVESEKPQPSIIGQESTITITKPTSPDNFVKESTITKSTSPNKFVKESSLKRSFQLCENDIKDITDRKKLPSMKKIKISKYSLRILPSDDEMDVDHVDIDNDDGMKLPELNGAEEIENEPESLEVGKLMVDSIQSENFDGTEQLVDNYMPQEQQKEVTDSSLPIQAGTTTLASLHKVNIPKSFTGGINLLNEPPGKDSASDQRETTTAHGSIPQLHTNLQQRQTLEGNIPKLFTGGINLLNEPPEKDLVSDERETNTADGSIHTPKLHTNMEQRQTLEGNIPKSLTDGTNSLKESPGKNSIQGKDTISDRRETNTTHGSIHPPELHTNMEQRQTSFPIVLAKLQNKPIPIPQRFDYYCNSLNDDIPIMNVTECTRMKESLKKNRKSQHKEKAETEKKADVADVYQEVTEKDTQYILDKKLTATTPKSIQDINPPIANENPDADKQIKWERFIENPNFEAPKPLSSEPLFMPQDESVDKVQPSSHSVIQPQSTYIPDESDLEEMERVNLEFHNVIASISGQSTDSRFVSTPNSRDEE